MLKFLVIKPIKGNAESLIHHKKNLSHSPFLEINENYLQANSILVSLSEHTKLTLSSTGLPGLKISVNNFKNVFKKHKVHILIPMVISMRNILLGMFIN